MANKTNLGRIVPVPVGGWSAATTYSKLDIVSYTNGSSYISKKDSNVNHNPATSSEWWQLLAEKGEKGQDGGGALSDTKPLKDSGTQGSAGTSLSVSRADHVHPFQVDDSIARKVDTGSIGSAGTSEYYARADHAHPANVTNTKPVKDSGTTGYVGSKSFYARSDHAHPFQVSYDTNYKPGYDVEEGNPGSSTEFYARSDHAHPLQVDYDTNYKPSQDAGSGNGGSAQLYARSDHAHPFQVDDSIARSVDATNFTEIDDPEDPQKKIIIDIGFPGESSVYARADHAHPLNVSSVAPAPISIDVAISTGTTPVVPDLIGSVGSSSAYARADHVHPAGIIVTKIRATRPAWMTANLTSGWTYRTGVPTGVDTNSKRVTIEPVSVKDIIGYKPIGIVGVNNNYTGFVVAKAILVDNNIEFNLYLDTSGAGAVPTANLTPEFDVLYVNTVIDTEAP